MSFCVHSVTEFAVTQRSEGRMAALLNAVPMALHLFCSCGEIVHHLMLVWLLTTDIHTDTHIQVYLFIYFFLIKPNVFLPQRRVCLRERVLTGRKP